MRVLVLVLVFPCLLVCAAFESVAAEEEGSDCAICHEEVVAAFQRTGHAIAPGWDAATGCQSCHGDGAAHMDAGGDPDAIIRPKSLTAQESSDICLACHQRQEKHFSAQQAIHLLSDVGCIDCHSPHSAADKMIEEDPLELCSGCHQVVASQFELPRSHPMGESGPACLSCHEPHATSTPRTNRSSSGQVCGACHFEKTVPMIYEHDTSIVDGCSSCHEVHGSPNRHLLRHSNQVNLCYECHNANTTPGWHSASRFLNEKCTACHAAIHGSNTSQFFLEE